MSENQVLLELDGRVAKVTLNRPDAMNALTVPMLKLAGDFLKQISSNSEIAVVVLTGAGRAFSAGVDVKALQAAGQDISLGDVGSELNEAARRVQNLLETMPQATVARVNGFCFTGAMEIMLACDHHCCRRGQAGGYACSDRPQTNLGMTQRLARKAGMMRAKELSFTARTITGKQAAEYGIAMESVPLADLDARIAEMTSAMAANSRGSIAAYKDLYLRSENAGLEEGLRYEADTTYRIDDVEERMAGILKRLGG